MAINVGDLVRISGLFVDENDNPLDPTNTFASFRKPSGSLTVYEYTVDVELVRDGVGDYHADISIDEAGIWTYSFYSTGNGQASAENTFQAFGTAITPGTTPTPTVAPIPYTWLSLARYATIMGISPAHFWGGFGQTVWPNTTCSKVYPRHTWQSSDRVSREGIANAIRNAEEEIADLLGFPLAPTWVYDEPHPYEQVWRRDAVGRSYVDAAGRLKSVRAKWAKIIDTTRRGLTLVDSPSLSGGELVYSDRDGDGFFETATITVTTTVTDPRELKIYFYGMSGDEEWEIREARSKTISGGSATFVFDSWLFIHPDLAGAFPTLDGNYAVDISDISNYVTQVDVYREYPDYTQVASQLFWEPVPSASACTSCSGSGCPACGLATQDGCLFVSDVDLGMVTPQPGTYDAGSASWLASNWVVGREPDQVKIWYRAGDMSRRFLRQAISDPLKDDYAYAIAYLATARLGRTLCSCAPVRALVEELQTDLTMLSPEVSHFSGQITQNNPFGTRRGEVWAWQRVTKVMPEARIEVAVF